MLAFVRLEILDFFRYVSKFDDPKELGEDIKMMAKSLLLLDGNHPFAAKLIDEAKNFSAKKSAAGKKGNAVRWAKKSSPNAQPTPPPELPEFYAYVAANDLDEAYAREWYDMCAARGWKDRDGNPILKWRGALTNYVKARVANAIATATKEEK